MVPKENITFAENAAILRKLPSQLSEQSENMTQVPQIPTMKNKANFNMIDKENAVAIAAVGGISFGATSANIHNKINIMSE